MLENTVNKINKISALLLIASASLLFSCGGTVQDPNPGSGKGSVALFITDNISFYKQVVATVTAVRLINSGLASSCEVLDGQTTLDLANLTDIAQYVDLTECDAGKYNVLEIDVRKDVWLMNQLNATSSCSFDAVLNAAGRPVPLDCDPVTGICTVPVRGGLRDGWVLVQEDRYNDLGIDFNLKEFTVNDFGGPACSVTMAAATISAADFNSSGRAHSVTGPITDLDTAADTFTLLANGVSLTVDYSGILPSLQPNIDVLLQTAQSAVLKVNVLTGGIDLETATISANRVYVKAAGSISALAGAPQWTFALTYAPLQSILGNYHPSHFNPALDLQGVLADGVWADVKFSGFQAGSYDAASIEVLPVGAALDD